MEAIADVSVTVSDADWLAEFTRAVVNDRLVACGNIVPAIRSIYRREGAIEDEPEAMVVFHRQSLAPELIERVNADHPYDTAQVVAVPVIGANPAYHQRVIRTTRSASTDCRASGTGPTSCGSALPHWLSWRLVSSWSAKPWHN